MDTIVIGEGVELDARPASAISRMLGALIDLAVLVAVLLLVAILLTNVARIGVPEAVADVGGTVAIAFVLIVLPTTVDTLTRGRTLGKLAVGIRVVRDDGGPIVFRQAFVRALVGVVELWLTFGSVALICSLVHPQGKRVGDILAGTYAVRVRGGAGGRAPLVMPPHLAVWARTADIARLPDGLALSVRQFLGRATRLHPGSRVELGTRLTHEVQRYVRPLPAPGTHPEAFLAAVLAERRDRELVAEQRASVRRDQEAVLLHRLPHGVLDPPS
ncbi:RDD family protein [Cellulomonas gelida]|uniref:Membrane protein n=1 Tax=Cellulomonas gelida TaxID=1712 RepID=A0A4Y3KHK2_9CELL|nr:RDD family protein [Cellulomonas gelida]GEA83492.1 membrane protein [Cellulomonas gelida]GGL24526.1 membrane protein [Cellulomonas gelida]